MSLRIAPHKLHSAVVASGLAIAALVVPLVAGSAASAASATGNEPATRKAHRLHRTYVAHHRHQVTRYVPEYGGYEHLPPNAIRMPGYVFVPGVGILGESCDLPTSACPNEYRDIQ